MLTVEHKISMGGRSSMHTGWVIRCIDAYSRDQGVGIFPRSGQCLCGTLQALLYTENTELYTVDQLTGLCLASNPASSAA